jgi:hypothetical protein
MALVRKSEPFKGQKSCDTVPLTMKIFSLIGRIGLKLATLACIVRATEKKKTRG